LRHPPIPGGAAARVPAEAGKPLIPGTTRYHHGKFLNLFFYFLFFLKNFNLLL
jgi:hypothetical protein